MKTIDDLLNPVRKESSNEVKKKDSIAQPSSNSQAPQISTEEVSEKFTEKIKEIKIKQKEKIIEARAKELGISYINLKGFPISQEALALIPQDQALMFRTICFFRSGEEIRLATTKPEDRAVRELLGELSKRVYARGGLYLISDYSFETAFKLYERLPKIREIEKGVKITEEELEKYKEGITSFKDINKKIQQIPITEIVAMITAGALKVRSSDIHIEAEEKDVKVRYRIDGILQDAAELQKELWPKIISRIKLLAGLKINITDVPQDGRFSINLAQEKIDVRTSTIPIAYGESVVMRLLMPSTIKLSFEDLGVRGKAYETLLQESGRPNGMIITTGPTGSGKTTTLYTVLTKLNEPGVKIITLEDPIEYKLKGINQSQIDHSKEYSFAKGIRSILRQDPDVIMVGEIRDLETADTAINAALTGHLVVSTLHTNSAAGAIPRFLAIGVKPFLLAPALNAIIAQRLVRRICSNCKEEEILEEKTLEKVKKILSEIPESSGEKVDLDNLKFYRGRGCQMCNGIGYKGRIGIYEVFTMNKEIEKLILSGQMAEYRIQELAQKGGMITMAQDGILKALDGITSVEEVFRVTV